MSPRFEKEFFASKLPEGLGKATVYGVIAAAGRRLGSGTAATTLVATQELAGQIFEDALKHGATLEQAFRARDLGLIEAIPIVPLLNKLTPEVRSRVLRTFIAAMKSGTEASVREAAEKLGKNLIANKIVVYDRERDTFEGVIDDATVSFSAGTIVNAIGGAIANQ